MKDLKSLLVSTDIFFYTVANKHLTECRQSYQIRYGHNGNFSVAGWENILNDIVQEIEYQIDIDKEKAPEETIYPYNVKIVKSTFNVEEPSIIMLCIDLNSEIILKITISFVMVEDKLIAIVKIVPGKIVFY